MHKGSKAPILLFVFNRPEKTSLVISAIKKYQPNKLYIVADGPRLDVENDIEKCSQTRKNIDLAIDWKCDVQKIYRDQNLGCKNSINSGLDWFFTNEDSGIILEDDILPSIQFFDYCETMLTQFQTDHNVFSISGCNLGFESRDDFFIFKSKYFNMWGWATWKRSWDLVKNQWYSDNEKINLGDLVKYKELSLGFFKPNLEWMQYWTWVAQMTLNGLDTWDYQFLFTCLNNSQRVIVPSKNLIVNIGFGSESTHTSEDMHPVASLKLGDLTEIDKSEIINFKIKKIKNYHHIYIAQVWCDLKFNKNFIENLVFNIKRNLK